MMMIELEDFGRMNPQSPGRTVHKIFRQVWITGETSQSLELSVRLMGKY